MHRPSGQQGPRKGRGKRIARKGDDGSRGEFGREISLNVLQGTEDGTTSGSKSGKGENGDTAKKRAREGEYLGAAGKEELFLHERV